MKKWIILGVLAFIAVCITFSNKQRLYYMYKLYTPIRINSIENHPPEEDGDFNGSNISGGEM